MINTNMPNPIIRLAVVAASKILVITKNKAAEHLNILHAQSN